MQTKGTACSDPKPKYLFTADILKFNSMAFSQFVNTNMILFAIVLGKICVNEAYE